MKICTSLFVAFFAMNSAPALAQAHNDPPPTGAILDLGGMETGTTAQSVNHGAPVTESVSFVAALSNTAITFAFREDPAFISFDNVSLTNTTTGSTTNLILNGDFSGGLANWTYANIYGASAGGQVYSSCPSGEFSGACWFDGAVQAYDAISQNVLTTVGDSYLLSFQYSDNGPLTTFSDLSTNGDNTDTGGNGIDILAYAQAGLPPAGGATPEPGSIALTATALLGLASTRLRRRTKA